MTIAAVIITYNPDLHKLEKVIPSLQNQVDKLLIVDNNSSNIFALLNIYPEVDILKLDKNYGIAYASNRGIEKLTNIYDFILLSDQDTVFPSDYISNFKINPFLQDETIAAFSPVIFDNVTKREKPVYSLINGKKSNSIQIQDFQYAYQAIASGLILRNTPIHNNGLFNEDLFIDMVDFEYCWRILENGYKILSCKNLVLSHELGDSCVIFFGIRIAKRVKIRYYYIIRNTLYLAKFSKYLNIKDRFKMFLKAHIYFITYTLISEHKIRMFLYLLKAMADGYTAKLGEYKNNKL